MSDTALDGLIAPQRYWVAGRVSGARIPIDDAAIDGLLSGLDGRLARVVGPCLAEEYRAGRAVWGRGSPPSGSAESWAARRRTWPGLGPVIDEVILRWREATAELLDRIAADRAQLGALGWLTGPPTLVRSISADAGDPHDRGRAVAIIEFDSGRVVYKPRDLRVVRAVRSLFDWLAERGWSHPNPVAPLVCGPSHAWMQYIEGKTLESASGFSDYYRRLGAQLRVFELLGARDLWLDNLVACGDAPIWVDLETVLHPQREAGGSPARRRVELQVADSLAHMAALSMRVQVEDGERAEDLGLLRAAGLAKLPFSSDPDIAQALDRSWPVVEGRRAIEVGQHLPRDRRGVANPEGFLDELEAGYLGTDQLLRALASELASPGGPLTALAGLPVRYVHRSTWTAYVQLRRSVQPDLLAEPTGRQNWLAREVASAGVLGPAEAEALRGGDVPMFMVHTDGVRVLASGEDLPLPGLQTAPLTSAFRRCAAPHDPQARDLFWRLTLASRGSTPLGRAPLSAVDPEEVGRAMMDEATIVGEDWAWLGAITHLSGGMVSVGVLPPTLLSGSGGLAVILAALAAEDPEKFGAAARGALRTLQTPLTPTSVWDGEAGCVLALTRAGRLLGEPWRAQAEERGRALIDRCATPAEQVQALWARLSPDSAPDPDVERLLDALDRGGAVPQPQRRVFPDPFDRLLPTSDQFTAGVAAWVRAVLGRPTPWAPDGISDFDPGKLIIDGAASPPRHYCAILGVGAEVLASLSGRLPDLWPLIPTIRPT